VGESDTMHDFLLEVSQDRYKGVSVGTVHVIVAEMSEEDKEQTKIFVARCVEGGTRLSLSGDLWNSDGMTLFAIFGHCINESFDTRFLPTRTRVMCDGSPYGRLYQEENRGGASDLWNDSQVKEFFEKGKKVGTFFKSSTIGRSEIAKVQEDLYGNKLGMLNQECKTQWSSTHNCGLSLMKTQENIQQFCVQERITDVEGNHFKMGVDDWDIIGQCTTSLMTITGVVKQVEGDKYPTSSLVLSIKQT
jgi:hypothetical protein